MIAFTKGNEAAEIRSLNDRLRATLNGGQVMITSGVQEKGSVFRRLAVMAVQGFDEFSEDNDPHGEHDFGSVEVADVRVFWKIDYYDRSMTAGSPDPANPEVTTRVLTIMLAGEY